MSKLIVLNHKMNMLYDDIYKYINDINNINTDNSIVVCPSNLYLESFVNHCSWGIGCQNFYYELEGDYTGEISTNQLKSIGVEYAMIGHYERKKYFGETILDDSKKIEAAIDANIMPILCFGEEKEEENINEVIKVLDNILENISHIEFITFAYEPAFSISSGKTYDIGELTNRINTIYEHLNLKYGVIPRIIYGGSVNRENVKDILQISNLCGIILGSSSIDVSFVEDIMKEI